MKAGQDTRAMDALGAHNSQQQQYFRGAIQRTIAPRQSLQLQRFVDRTLLHAGISPNDRVIEVGCGLGRFTMLLAQRNVHIEGLDLSPELLDRLRDYNGGRFTIPLHCADVLSPPEELEGGFDVVLGFLVLHHLADLDRSFVAMARLLKPGGRMVFLDANAYNPLLYLQIPLTRGMSWQGDRGLLQMRKGRVLGAMARAGLGHRTCTQFGFFPSFIADHQWGSRLEATLERVPLWRPVLPFQLFRAERV
jgi:SAM-dependent methyltransferase